MVLNSLFNNKKTGNKSSRLQKRKVLMYSTK